MTVGKLKARIAPVVRLQPLWVHSESEYTRIDIRYGDVGNSLLLGQVGRMAKVGRNAPCPCGSGQKYKRCHGDPLAQEQPSSDTFISSAIAQSNLESARDEARRLIQTQQQGLGSPIVSTTSGQNRVIAVGNQLFSSSKWKYFPDFLVEYSIGVLGRTWAKDEFEKPFYDRHPFMQWYDLFLQFQKKQSKRSDGTYSAVGTGAVNCFLGLSYSLYLLKHNVDLQDRLIARLRDVKQFQGAYYELIVANCLIRAGFELELEDESDASTKHCEFSAKSKLTNKKFWVEVKMRSVSGFLGKTDVDGATLRSKPTSRLAIHINEALEKPAEDERLIFVDVNADPMDTGSRKLDGKKAPAWLAAAAKHLDMRERDLRPGEEAYVLVTNIAFHRVPSQDICSNACLSFGMGISDFSKPGYRRLSETWKQKQKHIDLHNIMESLQAYPKIPSNFDGSLPLTEEDHANRLEINGTYFFEEIGEKGMLGTVTTATVIEKEKKIYFGITTEDGKSQIRQRAMSDTELRSYQSHSDAFFGVVQPVSKGNLSPYEMFEWLLETYRETPREKLLEFLKTSPDFESLSELNDLELALEYCERIATSMAQRRPK